MDRRAFLRSTAALSSAGLASALDLFPLSAQAATTDYKALVCVFLFGGVDGNNVVVPIDTEGYAAYAAVRGANSGIQLTRNELLPDFSRPLGLLNEATASWPMLCRRPLE